MPANKCAICDKTAYPLESVVALDKHYHKGCFKCAVCASTLNLKNFKGFEGKIYCATHTPKVKNTAVTESVSLKAAQNAPKKDIALGVHKADKKVAPQTSGDFSVNQSGDQSTENNPEESGITYEQHGGDQSTENQPEESGITYEQYNGDQSTENQPEESGIQYEQYNGDQSTENQPEDSNVQYEQYNQDQSTGEEYDQ